LKWKETHFYSRLLDGILSVRTNSGETKGRLLGKKNAGDEIETGEIYLKLFWGFGAEGRA